MNSIYPPMTREHSALLASMAVEESSISREERLMRSLAGSSFRSTIPTPRPVRVIDEMPEDVMSEMASKLFALMNLSWSYIDTVIDLVIQMSIPETKPLVRAVRQIRREYDQFRAVSIDSSFEKSETTNAENFEEFFSSDFDRLFNGVQMEVRKLGLRKDHETLVIAVHQAMTIMDSVVSYARMCDKIIRKHGVWAPDCCLVQNEFLRLFPLIPQFAGECYLTDIPARKLSAQILANRISESKINIIDD